jgi:hypothetical protein
LEALGLGVAARHADAEGIAEVDARQLGRSRTNELQIAGGQRPLKAWVGGAGVYQNERMFASPSSPRARTSNSSAAGPTARSPVILSLVRFPG